MFNRGKKAVPLDEFLRANAARLNLYLITSLMMPLALYIRDRHLRGELCLRLSPKYIKVAEKGCVFNDRLQDDGFAQQRFLSPEQLNHSTAGIASDIYSFCAVLYYMLPKPVDGSADTAAWKAVVDKGLSPEPAERYASMQELIYALSPYNGVDIKGLFVKTEPARHEAQMAAPAPTAGHAGASGAPVAAQVPTAAHAGASGAPMAAPAPAAGQNGSAPSAAADVEQTAITGKESPDEKQGKARKKSAGFRAGIAAACVAGAVIVYATVNLIGAKTSIAGDNFKSADTFLKLLLLDEQLLPKDRAYVDAGLALQAQKFDAAIQGFTLLGAQFHAEELARESLYQKAAFNAGEGRYDDAVALYAELGDYKDSADLVKETKYQKAASLADSDQYDDSIALYQELGDYKNSAGLVSDTISRKGYYLIGQKNYSEAMAVFESLKDKNYAGYDEIIVDANYQCVVSLIADKNFVAAYDYIYKPAMAGYKDASELLIKIKDEIYKQAKDYYHSQYYELAKTYFTKLNSYKDSNKYLELCNFLSKDIDDLTQVYLMMSIYPLIGFDNTAELLVSNQLYGELFLKGTWSGGGHYFKIKKDGTLEHDLFYYSDGYYRIENGYFYTVDKDGNILDTEWKITVHSENTVTIYVEKTAKTYTMNRQ
jgi:hypothetical protein